MTINNNSSKHQRITEVFDLCRQRYLEAGGNPHKSVDCQQWMSEAEKQEFLQLGQQLIDPQKIADYQQQNGSWRDQIKSIQS